MYLFIANFLPKHFPGFVMLANTCNTPYLNEGCIYFNMTYNKQNILLKAMPVN